MGLKAKIDLGQDPIKERKEKRDLAHLTKEAKTFPSFEKVAIDWLNDRNKNGFFRNNAKDLKKHCLFKKHVSPKISRKSINSITPEVVHDLIAPLWETKTNTAKKILTYLGQIFNWSIALRIRDDRENPTDLHSALGVLLEPSRRNKKESENHAAISVDEMPLLYAELDAMQSVSARALQFAFLTASRSKAVRSANWDEFDLDNALWIILVEHDKMKQRKRGRTIVLSRQAVELIKGLPRYSGQQRVFLSNQMNTLSDMTLSMHLRRMLRRKKTDDNLG